MVNEKSKTITVAQKKLYERLRRSRPLLSIWATANCDQETHKETYGRTYFLQSALRRWPCPNVKSMNALVGLGLLKEGDRITFRPGDLSDPGRPNAVRLKWDVYVVARLRDSGVSE